MKTRALTNGERLAIHRRRGDESQRDAAERIGVSLYQYRRWEADLDEPPKGERGVRGLHLAEIYWLHRRRAGMSLAELAKRLGCSNWWLTKMEGGDEPVSDALKQFWVRRKADRSRRARAG